MAARIAWENEADYFCPGAFCPGALSWCGHSRHTKGKRYHATLQESLRATHTLPDAATLPKAQDATDCGLERYRGMYSPVQQSQEVCKAKAERDAGHQGAPGHMVVAQAALPLRSRVIAQANGHERKDMMPTSVNTREHPCPCALTLWDPATDPPCGGQIAAGPVLLTG